MKTIGISEFETLIRERLASPEAFSGKTLVLCNSFCGEESIAYNVIRNCCIKHNLSNKVKQVWYKYSLSYLNEDFSELKACCDYDENGMYGFKTQGIFFNDEQICPFDSIDYFKNWLRFVNEQKTPKGHLSPDWSLIVCAYLGTYHFNNGSIELTERFFSDNCELCSIQPAVEEWAEWIKQFTSEDVIGAVVSYINQKGQTITFDRWNLVIGRLNTVMIDKDYKTLSQLTKADCESFPLIDGFNGDDFLDFIHITEKF